MPNVKAFLPAISAAREAAKGVDFFVPLNPTAPEEEETIVFPCESAIVTSVLLKVDFI